ncbi:MAG TPA: SUMF1/EgtB/PvdO family nonheme iron enzyme, partial [Terriglobia bacterium]|nr:SUMF1/EgtB/PvdO family nonheme iron enzyme [Terriglobia bacterium]
MRLLPYLLGMAVLIQQTAIRVDVNLQQVRFSVRDGAGAAVASLSAEDVIVEENGIRQSAVNLRQDSETPVSFGILIRTVALDSRALSGDWQIIDVVRAAAWKVIRQMKPQDEVVIMTDTDDRPVVPQQQVKDQRGRIEAALETILPYDGSRAPKNFALPHALATVKALKHRSHVLIVFNADVHWFYPDDDPHSAKHVDGATRIEEETPIYFFDTWGDFLERSGPPQAAWDDATGFKWERNYEFWANPFSEQTGGHTFRFDLNALHSTKALSRLDAFIDQMNLDLRSSYTLEYYSPVPSSTPRRIRIQAISPDYRVHIEHSPIQLDGSREPAVPPGSTILSRTSRSPNPETATFTNDGFVSIPRGEFLMGCSPTDPACYPTDYGTRWGYPVSPNAARLKPWRVRIGKAFEIGKHEVTQAQWEAVMGTNPSYFRGADRPVEQVSWEDIQEFLKRMNARKDGYRYRLPSEEEWEYVARTGQSGPYEASIDSTAWYVENSGRQTHPVGTKERNTWGVYDIYGNVFEWIQDSNLDRPRDFG